MNELLQNLIAALRDELEQYGEMFALLEQQQDLIVQRAADKLLETVTAINEQMQVLNRARQHREECQRALAAALQLPAETTFAEWRPLLPEDYRPLVSALIDENNNLLVRMKQRARQNHLLLSRSLELMQALLSTLFQAANSTVYDAGGGVTAPGLAMPALCNAVG